MVGECLTRRRYASLVVVREQAQPELVPSANLDIALSLTKRILDPVVDAVFGVIGALHGLVSNSTELIRRQPLMLQELVCRKEAAKTTWTLVREILAFVIRPDVASIVMHLSVGSENTHTIVEEQAAYFSMVMSWYPLLAQCS
jgi:hypothetical protein